MGNRLSLLVLYHLNHINEAKSSWITIKIVDNDARKSNNGKAIFVSINTKFLTEIWLLRDNCRYSSKIKLI